MPDTTARPRSQGFGRHPPTIRNGPRPFPLLLESELRFQKWQFVICMLLFVRVSENDAVLSDSEGKRQKVWAKRHGAREISGKGTAGLSGFTCNSIQSFKLEADLGRYTLGPFDWSAQLQGNMSSIERSVSSINLTTDITYTARNTDVQVPFCSRTKRRLINSCLLPFFHPPLNWLGGLFGAECDFACAAVFLASRHGTWSCD